ncbi:uncharacterized protein G2W53_017691 [Senna tora]|uniref:Uncharacterized protein n=1 Tax=Senna tora TaxID=362788 RepID=A0A834TSE9_9FABA|nr:uncharacterized protein G2W53_017691 [Senna tora]
MEWKQINIGSPLNNILLGVGDKTCRELMLPTSFSKVVVLHCSTYKIFRKKIFMKEQNEKGEKSFQDNGETVLDRVLQKGKVYRPKGQKQIKQVKESCPPKVKTIPSKGTKTN